MNRHDRRAVRAASRRAAKAPESVALEGGPMDGWVVTPMADALRPDWYRTWLPSIAAAWHPGRYARSGAVARWEAIDE